MDTELSEILGSIDELASRGKITRNRAFAAWFAINFFNIDEDDALEAAAADGGNDQGIDIVFADESTQEIVVIQAHCPENFSKRTPKSKWDAVTASLPYIVNPKQLANSGRPDLAESISNIQAAHQDYTTVVGLISLGEKSDQIDRAMHAMEESGSFPDFTYFSYSQSDIKSKYRSLVESEGGIPEDELNFSGEHFEDSGEYGRSWVGSVSAAELKRLHQKHQDKLFAGNIRLFLGSRKGGINEQIIKTAKETPGNFWALNNGITIVADHVERLDKNSSKLKLKRFSIVNGCQTTSSLARADADASAKVLARIIAAKQGLKNEIVRYNNSQNAVKIWTVRAADDVQNSLRKEFSAAKIDYAPKQEGSRKKRNLNTIELDKVSQYLAASQQNYLIQAIDNKSELFDQPYQHLFRRGVPARDVYLAWLTGNIADQERQKLFDQLKGDQNSGLLSVTSGYWIVYITYKLYNKFSDVKSTHVSLDKMKSPEFSNAIKKYVSKAASIFYDAAIDTYDREDYGSFKSTLRSSKFLQKIDSKTNARITNIKQKELPELVSVCKSVK